MTDLGQHANRLLEVLHERPPMAGERLLSDMDWASHGVSHPYGIFITGRCGSTWLTSLLAETSLAGRPEELFNSDVATYEPDNQRGIRHYLASAVQRHGRNGRFGLQVDAARLRDLDPMIDFGAMFGGPASTSFVLYRRDLFSQAWSWIAARQSGIWHDQNQGERPTVSSLRITDAMLVEEIARLRSAEEFLIERLSAWGVEPHFIDYESLVAETGTVLSWMLATLGINPVAAPPLGSGGTRKLGYADKDAALGAFMQRHPRLAQELQRNRFGVPSTEVPALATTR